MFMSQGKNLVPCATKDSNNHPLTDVIFEPFEEVKKELNLVPTVPQASLARKKYTDDYKATIKEQISVEYNVSYVYHVIFAYFDRDNVALKGLANSLMIVIITGFSRSQARRKGCTEKLMEYQNKRGGKVKLQSIVMPLSEFGHEKKGDALFG
ncbi:Ferritin-3, chloroplastic [Glycine soja]